LALGLIWKPIGEPSSQWLRTQAAKWRRESGFSGPLFKGVGHTGTLDPFAEGLLLFGLDEGTKLFPILQGMPKRYRARFSFGQTSSSFDTDETVHSVSMDRVPSDAELRRFLLAVTQAEFDQVPPQHSAVKVAGQKARDRVREGKDLVLEPRRVRVWSAELLSYEFLPSEALLNWECELLVKAGTYVRALARDWGLALTGQPGLCLNLQRVGIGPWTVEPETLREARPLGVEDLSDCLTVVKVPSELAHQIKSFGKPVSMGESNLPRMLVNESTGECVGLLDQQSRWIRVFQSDPFAWSQSAPSAAP
jgi:tRNA pseudouridine(55) synthase